MHRVLLLGAGKIGRMAAKFLARSGDYDLLVADSDAEALRRIDLQEGVPTRLVNAADPAELGEAMQGRESVISALSYQCNPAIAEAALVHGLSYFDLTEDVATTKRVRAVAQAARPGQIFMPQCGLAPGFVSIAAYHLTQDFDEVENVYMRVGALPQFPSNALKYNLTWSTDGLINEYCNPCESIHEGQRIQTLPLEGLDNFSLDGVHYEAFNTSGGVGTLCETLEGRVRELNYKTIRYVGHRDLMHFLIEGLRLGRRRELLKQILEESIPVTFQDVVVIFCTVTGSRDGKLLQTSDARKIYRQTIDGQCWSAIQITTAAGVCAALDLHVSDQLPKQGFVRQEQIDFEEFLDNRFGRHFQTQAATRFTAPLGSAAGATYADGNTR